MSWVSTFVCPHCGKTMGRPVHTEHEPLLDGVPMLGYCWACRTYFPAKVSRSEDGGA
jgi:hypothetical protein